jgi:hypothetical protein
MVGLEPTTCCIQNNCATNYATLEQHTDYILEFFKTLHGIEPHVVFMKKISKMPLIKRINLPLQLMQILI